MKSTYKTLSGLVAIALVMAGIVWTVPGGSIAGPGAAARSAGSAVQQAGPEEAAPVVGEVFVSEPSVPTISPAVRDLPDLVIDPSLDREMAKRDYFGFVGTGYQGPAWLDPLVEVQSRAPLAASDAFTTPLTNWAGMDYNSYPPDTTGDVGPNHYVQAVNGSGGSTVQIYNKSGSILKTFAMESLSGTSPCNSGYCDPIVIYDSLADRWFISEFSSVSGYAMCLYVSTTPDPTGTWYAYVFDLSYYDYPKYGVWPDAYYMGYNGGPTGYRQVFAFDRAKMLAGQTATYQSFNVASLSGLSFQLLVPASWEGPAQPPAGLGGLFGRPRDTEVSGPTGYGSVDFLDLYEFDVNWTTPANSTLTKLPDIPIGEYDCSLCGTGSDWSCMPQPGTTQALDPIREPLHQPLQYRNWGSYETLVGGFAEDVNGADQAAVRWFELRRPGGTWAVHQEGVVGGGDSNHRSVTSVAMDGAGGIALGYTLTSSSVYPSIRYAGRRSWDPLGTMAYVDVVAQAGTGSQASYDRWGDYSGIGIDPADDCTFWFTTEYMSGSSSATRVISFRHDADFSPDAAPNSLTVCRPADAVYAVQAAATCAFSGNVAMSVTGLPSGATAAWSVNPVTPPGSTTLTIGSTGAADLGTYNITITGTSGGTTRSEVVLLTLLDSDPLGAVTLSAPSDGSTGAGTTPTLSWQTVTGASSYDIQVATDPDFSNLVISASGLTGTTYTVGSALSQDTLYYWRVTANNQCGPGSASATWAFRTAASGCVTYPSSDVPKAIPDRDTVYSNLPVGDSFNLTDVNVTIGSIVHTYDGDLNIYLEHPDNTAVELSTDNGGTGDNYTSTVLDDEASTAITAGTAPFTGSYRPEGSLAALDGKTSAGTWRLRVSDDSRADTGTLNSWSLTLCGAPTSSAADYSDLASGYGIAWHTGSGALKLGASWDADTTFGAGTDDASDDGVAFPNDLGAGGTSIARVTVQGTAANGRWLRLWFDWNGDGVFGDAAGGELVYNASVSDGVNDITVSVPAGQALAPNYRARLYDSAGAPAGGTEARASSSFGGTAGGEVEDGLGPTPTSVDLVRFEAWPEGSAIHVQWETAQEIDNLGFNLYRSNTLTGPKLKLNAQLIPTLVPPGTPFGAIYDWIDTYRLRPGRAYFYWLEDVDLYGGTAMHGPVRVRLP